MDDKTIPVKTLSSHSTSLLRTTTLFRRDRILAVYSSFGNTLRKGRSAGSISIIPSNVGLIFLHEEPSRRVQCFENSETGGSFGIMTKRASRHFGATL